MGNHNNTKEKTIVISGTGRVSKTSNIYRQYGYFQMNIEFIASTTEIIGLAVTCPVLGCPGAKKLKNALVGSKLEKGLQKAMEMLHKEIFCINSRTVISAIEDLGVNYEKYKKFFNNKNNKNRNSVNSKKNNNTNSNRR